MSRSRFLEKLLWVYVILLPIMEVPSIPLLCKKLQYADLVFLVLLGVYIFSYARGELKFRYRWFDLLVLGFLFSCIPSFYNSSSILTSTIEFLGRIYLAVLYFLVKNIVDTKEKLLSLINIWVIVSVIVTVFGIVALAVYRLLGYSGINVFVYHTSVELFYNIPPRMDSTFRNANMYASYLLPSIICGFILLLDNFENKRRRVLYIFFLVILFLGAFFSGSRQQIGIYLASFLILLKLDKRGRIICLLRHLSFAIFIILLVIGVLTTVWVVLPVDFKNDAKDGIFAITMNSKHSWHLFPHSVAINMIKRHPISGVGLGTFRERFAEFADWERADSSYHFLVFASSIKDRSLTLDPLSTYLGSFSETGLIGFVVLMILLFSFGFRLYRFYIRNEDKYKAQIAWFILSGFIGFLINGFIIEFLTMRHFWMMLAMGIVLLDIEDRKALNSGKEPC